MPLIFVETSNLFRNSSYQTINLLPMANEQAPYVNMILLQWELQNKRSEKLFAQISDEQFLLEVSSGKNTGRYLLGHLASVNDLLFNMLELGEPMHPELEKPFVTTSDKSGQDMPSVAELRQYWSDITAKLTSLFRAMEPTDWFKKHSLVNAEDFAKEPHRNKLNVLLTRIIHQGYHLGQIALLVKK